MTQVTIGMPVYNGAFGIRAALDSLLAQTFKDFVIVISDNGSTDETEEICRAYQQQDERIRYVRQPVNLGAAMNYRFVLFEARTPYFMWVAADDLWACRFIETHLAVLNRDPLAVASQSKVLFTVNGETSHLATGTYALPHDARRNAALFLRNPADNSRYYCLFRTSALQAVFPIRSFYGLDWAVSASTLRFGTHVEVPEVLMIRDSSDPSTYARAVANDHRRLLWRVFPILFMTKWLLLGRRVPLSPAVIYYMFKLNLYMHLRFGLYRWGRFAEGYLATNSVRATAHMTLAGMVRAVTRPGLRQRTAGAARRIKGAGYRIAHRAWQAMPLTLQTRDTMKRRVFQRLGRRAQGIPAFQGWVVNVVPATTDGTRDLPPPPLLPTSGWKMPAPLDGRPAVAALIIVAHDDILSTFALLDSLASVQGELPLEVILVDNGSTDITSFVSSLCPGIIHRRLPQAVPYGEAAMVGVAAATADRLIFAEQKLLLRANFLQAILAALDHGDMVGPQSRYADDRLRAAGGVITMASANYGFGRGGSPSDPEYTFAREVDYCPAAFAIARATLEAVGGFSRAYRTFEITGLELAVRLYAEHKQIRYLPTAVVTDYSGIYDPASADYAHSNGWMGDWKIFVERNGMRPHLREQQEASHPRRHDLDRTKRALFIDADTPTPDQNAGSVFALNLMRMLGDLGFRVTFVPESNFAHRGKYTGDLQRYGVHAIYHPFYSSVREVLERIGHECDIIVGCRAYIAEKYFDMFRELAPNARIVFNTIDLHALRMTREAELSKDPALLLAAEAQWVSELASIAKADATIVVSTYEKEILAEKLPAAKVHVVPLVHDMPDHLDVPNFAGRSDLMFIGTYQHPPNHDAAIYFVKEIWPKIHRRLPEARFLVVGSSVTPEILALAGDGIEVLGFVEDLDSLMAACRLTVAPLRFGAGLKGKVSSSLLSGVPVVASSIAVEGTTLAHEHDVLIADAPQEFADAVVRLYTDQALWERLSSGGFEYARKEFSIAPNMTRLLTLLGDIGLASELQLIRMELADADPLYQPSEFWQMLSDKNVTSIESNIHLFKRTVNNNYFQWLPGDFNDNQVRNLIDFWRERPSMMPLEVAVDSEPEPEMELIKDFNNHTPFENPRYFRFYAFFVGLLWYYAACNDPIRLHERLEEPLLGSPIPVRHGSRLISQDLANSLHEWSRIHVLMEACDLPEVPCILELGAGYGRLAHVFLTAQRCRYVIVDIPPALRIAKWYLEHLFPNLKIFGFRRFSSYADVWAEIQDADICFLTGNQLAMLPHEFADVSVSISSLHEMRFDQIANYKALLEEKTKSVIYLKQWTSWTNPSDRISVGRQDFILAPPWQLVLDCPHAVHDAMTELGFLRKDWATEVEVCADQDAQAQILDSTAKTV